MSQLAIHDLENISKLFQIDGHYQVSIPYGNGHINDTYLITFERDAKLDRYIAQRINHYVFTQPIQVMQNIEQVTSHIAEKLHRAGVENLEQRVLQLIPAQDGKNYAFDANGNLWRVYNFIADMSTYDVPQSTSQVFEVGYSFGEFQTLLMDLSPNVLHETIPNFHHTRSRFQALQKAITADPCNRAYLVRDEIKFAAAREHLVDALLDLEAKGLVPARVIHNDTKMNNLLIDGQTERGMCVTDLDTTMPGLALYDFGDMVRTATVTAAEDEQDLRKVRVQMDMFKALVNGYMTSAGSILNNVERDHLVTSGKVITLEIGIRFLTDYLQGDVYFKTSRPEHNLDRARTQFKLVESIESQENEMQHFVENWQVNGFRHRN